MGIRVLSGGMLTTVQDGGRVGYQQFGVSVAGVMDPRSAAIANLLVGNKEEEAVVEMTMLGPRLTFTTSNLIAITGGDFAPQLDGRPMELYCATLASPGMVLSFASPRTGCRAFIAFAGGLDLPIVMGSRSTDLRAGLGGFRGRKLQPGDEISFRMPQTTLPNLECRRMKPERFGQTEKRLRVVMGPQDDLFTPSGIETFLSTCYTVSNRFDRMGCCLDGKAIAHLEDGNIISDGISFGAVQVPSGGYPIIMLADRQTTGGYAKIANVISTDLPIIAQAKSGDSIRFEKVDIHTAQRLYLEQKEERRRWRQTWDTVAAQDSPIRYVTVTVNGIAYHASIVEADVP
ncbi:MAG: biotin-dependent carboxyltransferase family protein [Oscillospiraceae bacterium]